MIFILIISVRQLSARPPHISLDPRPETSPGGQSGQPQPGEGEQGPGERGGRAGRHHAEQGEEILLSYSEKFF